MRLLKTAIGILLIGFAGFIIIGEQLSGASADAVVNARLTTVRAPIAGRVSIPAKALGARVQRGDPLGNLSDPLVDRTRLADLINEQSKAAAEIRRLHTALEAVDQSIAKLSDRSKAYQKERIRQLEAQVSASKALTEASRAQLALYRKMFERSSQLSSRGIEAQANLEQAQSRVQVAQRELENAQAQMTVNLVGLDAARRGTFLGDGYNDAPYSEQRIGDLLLRKDEIEADLAAQSEISSALEARISAERVLVNRLSSAPLIANVNGIFWTMEIADGEVVQRGQDLLQLVDCDTSVVTLSVSESVYNALTVGASAEFRMTGGSRVFNGTVTRLAGAGAEEIYRNLAIAPSEKHLERYDVALSVPALTADSNLRCQIGRTGRAFFDRGPLDWLLHIWH
jgi:multidrug resistance efflux pump